MSAILHHYITTTFLTHQYLHHYYINTSIATTSIPHPRLTRIPRPLRLEPNRPLTPTYHQQQPQQDYARHQERPHSPAYPVLYDSNRTVLLLPPFINSNHSKITLDTKSILIVSPEKISKLFLFLPVLGKGAVDARGKLPTWNCPCTSLID
jgi:hypothetical protein